ncbi:MAG: hypothetical protein ACFFCV_11760 [Promethearchaeota archaeon]
MFPLFFNNNTLNLNENSSGDLDLYEPICSGFEPNNSILNATLINEGDYDNIFIDGEDWFKISIKSNQSIILIVRVWPQYNDLDIEFYDSNQSLLIGAYEMTYDKESLCYYIKNSGTYFIRIFNIGEIIDFKGAGYDMVLKIKNGNNTCTQREGLTVKKGMEFLYKVDCLESSALRTKFGENWSDNPLFPKGANKINAKSKIRITNTKEIINNSIPLYEIEYDLWSWVLDNRVFGSTPNMTNLKCWSYKYPEDFNVIFPYGPNKAFPFIPKSDGGFLKGIIVGEGWNVGKYYWHYPEGSLVLLLPRCLSFTSGNYSFHWSYNDYGWLREFCIVDGEETWIKNCDERWATPIYRYTVELLKVEDIKDTPSQQLDMEVFQFIGFLLIPIIGLIFYTTKKR